MSANLEYEEQLEKYFNRLLIDKGYLFDKRCTYRDLRGEFSKKEFCSLCSKVGLSDERMKHVIRKIEAEDTNGSFYRPTLEDGQETGENRIRYKIRSKKTPPNLKEFQDRINDVFDNAFNLRIYYESGSDKDTYFFYADKDKLTAPQWYLITDFFTCSCK